jgi:hypothetical protein
MQLDRVPMYLADLRFATERVTEDEDQTSRRVVVPVFRIEPFTRDVAAKLVPGALSKLFEVGSGNPTDDLQKIELGLHAPLVTLELRQAGDTVPSVEVTDVRLTPRIVVRRDKETPTYSALLKLNFQYPSAKDLLFLAHALNTQLLVTLVEQQIEMDLQPDEADEQEPVEHFRPLTAREQDEAAKPTARRRAAH